MDTNTTKPKRARRTKAEMDSASQKVGAQQQAKAFEPKADAAPKKRSTGTRAAGTGAGSPKGQQQSMGQQGAGTAGTELRGGTKQVLITEMAMGGRTGRPAGEEDYPFGELLPSKMVGKEIVGPSFFIPDSDSAEGKVAVARKRHKALFWTRTRTEQVNGAGDPVPGKRVWRGTPELVDVAKR